MRKYFIITVLLFMLPVSMALAMTTASPPTAINNNGAELTAVIATPDATVLTNADGITVNSGADLISAGITIDTAQITGINLASTADKTNGTNGKDVDGANATITRNTDTANFTDRNPTIAITPKVTSSNSENVISISGMTNGSADGVYFYRIESAAYVLKIVIPTGVNTGNKPLVESAITISQTADRAPVTTLKIPTDLVANNTGALTTLSTNSLVNTAINTPTASATIDYSILQTGHEVRTLTGEEQAAAYRMDLGVTTSATEQIAVPDMAMINSADAVYFTDITVTAMVQTQENAAYANDLAGFVSEGSTIPVDTIADTASGRAPTITYSGTFAFDIAGAGLTLNAA